MLLSPNLGTFFGGLACDLLGCDLPDDGDLSVTTQVASLDPNDIIGPRGFGPEGFIVPTDQPLDYTIRFENLDQATAPAQVVTITQELDPDLDFGTLELDSFGFGGLIVEIPEGRDFLDVRLDLVDTLGVFLDVDTDFNTQTGLLTWTFTSVDPETFDLPTDPLAGFLPPNKTSPEGEGFVSYRIKHKSAPATATRIDAQARIVFDLNDPIDTPAIVNTIDAGPPESSVNPLPAVTTETSFAVNWTGTDDAGGSGIAFFDVLVSTDGGEFLPYVERTTETSATFNGENGRTYAFYSVATDNVGHPEETPPVPDAETTIHVNTPPLLDAIGDKTIDEEALLTFLATAEDQDLPADTLTFSLDTAAEALGMSITSGGAFSWTPTESQGGASYSVTVIVSDGSLSDLETISITVAEVVSTVVDLGPIDFLSLEHLSLADGSLYYRVETSHDGVFSLQVDVPKPPKSARLNLYDANPAQTTGLTSLAQSSLDEDGNQRIDWLASARTVYYVEVYGDNLDFDVRLANLLHHDASTGTVTVHGTDGSDTFEFDAAASRDVSINGVRYYFDDAEVDLVTFDGGQGFDVVEIRDSRGDDTLEAWPDRVILSNGPIDATLDFNVEVTGFEDMQAYAVAGGSNTALLHGSPGNDKLKSYLSPDDDFVRLRAKDQSYSLRAKLFARVTGDAGSSRNDMAVFAGSEGDDTFRFTGSENTAQIERPGRDHAATAFDRVIARAGGGDADLAYFTDMPGEGQRTDDVFYFKPHKTQLVGQAVNVTARAFDEVHAEDKNGGFGVARIYDTSEDDHFQFTADTARVYRRIGAELDLLYETIAFERVKAYRTTGNDTKDDANHVFGDELFLYGWDA